MGPIPCNLKSTTGKSASFRPCVRAKLRVAVNPMRFSPVVLVSLRSIAPVAGGGGVQSVSKGVQSVSTAGRF